MSSAPERPIRILSFDGGGVRGLSSLLLLRGLMERLSVKRGITPPDSIRPSDYFDLIIGTGTGGISALLVGRMRMTVGEAINAYMTMAETAFEPVVSNHFTLRLWNQTPTLDGLALQCVIGGIAQAVLGDRSAPFEDFPSDSTTCRTAVLAARGDYIDAPPHVFRSYSSRQPASPFSITAVARATIATSSTFRPILLGTPPVRFVDAGISGHNNPVEVGLSEAAELWPNRDIHCVVSLGTGLQRIIAVGEGWKQVANACRLILEGCEQVHDRVLRAQKEAQYFRFNVDRGLDTDVMEWKDEGQCGKIAGVTAGYMSWVAIDRRLNECASALNGEASIQNPSTANQGHTMDSLLSHHPAPDIFHGREEYVQVGVNMLLQKEGVRLAILGPGGIGKTAIACTILHDSRVENKFGKHRCFISCEGTNSIMMLVDMFCAAFSLGNLSGDPQTVFLGFLGQTYKAKPLLLILDNFETIWEVSASKVENLLASLAKIAGISLLLTMRGSERPAGMCWTKPYLDIVKPLSAAAAYQTFTDTCAHVDEMLPNLLQELDYIPLAVTLMAHLAQVEYPSFLLERWRKERTKILSQNRDQGRLKNVDTSICVSLESHRMQSCPDALVLLSIIALLPIGAPRSLLSAMTPKIPNRNFAVTTLLQTGLAYNDNAQTLCVLSPIRLYILEHHQPEILLLHDLESFYFQLARDGAKNFHQEGYRDNMKSLLDSAANMEAILAKALEETNEDESTFEETIGAAVNWTNCLRFSNPRDTIIQLAIEACQNKNDNKILYAQCLQSLGVVQWMISNYTQAEEMLSAAQTRFEVLGDQLGATQCLQQLGHIYWTKGHFQQASEVLSAAKIKFEAFGNKLETARCLQGLGHIQGIWGNYPQAQEMLSAAQTMCDTVGDWIGATQCLQHLGNIQKLQRNFSQAQEMLSAAHKRFERNGYQLGATQCLRHLGNLQMMQGNYLQAQDMLTAAQASFEALGDYTGATHCLLCLGNIQGFQHNYTQALEILSTARLKYEATGDQLGLAHSLLCLGDIQAVKGNYLQAQELLSAAQNRYENMRHQQGAAQCVECMRQIQQTQILGQ